LASDQGVTVVTIDNPNKQLTVTVPIVEGVDPTQIAEHAPGVNEHLDPELEANIHSIIHENQHDKNQDDKEFDEDDIDEFDELDEELNQENQPNQHNRVTKDKAGVKHSNFDEVEEADDVSEEDTSKPAEKDAESGPESKEQETIDEKELDETENAKKGTLRKFLAQVIFSYSLDYYFYRGYYSSCCQFISSGHWM
jgi:flagellar biosynthesis GTPase FlhF